MSVAVELRAVSLACLQALAEGHAAPDEPWPAAEGALPPRHVACRALDLLGRGCLAQWAIPFHIVDPERQRIVGGCGFKGAPVNGEVEVGYGVAPAELRRGYASAGLRGLLQRVSAEESLQAVIALIAPDNLASQATAARVGFGFDTHVVDADGERVMRWVWSKERTLR